MTPGEAYERAVEYVNAPIPDWHCLVVALDPSFDTRNDRIDRVGSGMAQNLAAAHRPIGLEP